MQFYSSMTLADFLAVNWTLMDPNVVSLIEREADRIDELEEDLHSWKEIADDNQALNEDNRDYIIRLIQDIKEGKETLENLERFVREMETA
ncbi:hypothetical protein [Xanthomonas phage BUDD]|nr:hypothetical protein [Xanthomonas phage BUDD]